MKRLLLSLLVLAAAAGLASAQTPQAPAAPVTAKATPEKLASDTPRTTAGGATLTAPKDWSITVDGSVMVLVAPDGDSRIGIVELGADVFIGVRATY